MVASVSLGTWICSIRLESSTLISGLVPCSIRAPRMLSSISARLMAILSRRTTACCLLLSGFQASPYPRATLYSQVVSKTALLPGSGEYATLEPVRELLLQMFMGEKFGRDSIWETHLAEELWMTQVEVEAVLDQLNMKLSDVFALQPGSQLMLNATPTSLIKMSSGGFPLYTGSMGRKGEQMAIRIEDRLIKDDEEMR
ncbi:MAG: hypothetical protein HN360_05175 [Rhodospirillaceae bacterium]|nr:hypothetical protein [Rhodospirillaceae bacterium]MBT4220436.1 hypothetical protein [Rhodospirillaceae bacterium]MBT4464268.1 hypothetical protein [Rhodospirillaceae bacterium]MBT7356104.1 hypothetical protein [Rhodospirillaceae bacterium]